MPILITIVCILIVARILVIYKSKIDFYSKGLDKGFLAKEISALWKLSRQCHLENPEALYVSVPALNDCINSIISKSKADGTDQTKSVQDFLSKLYQYRTRIALESEKKKGLESTHYLSEGQKVRIILRGKGVFVSRIVNTGRELTVSLPIQYSEKAHRNFILSGSEWEGKNVSVYLWRKGDASYAFDTVVVKSGTFKNEGVLFLRHTEKLDRAQKRQSIRAACEIYAQMYMIKSNVISYESVNTEAGYRCLLEDISEDGAMIRIGGKGRNNVKIKLQFTVNNSFIMMYGVIRAVEYNASLDQSRLHFECTHIAPSMKNAILSFVYNVIPPEEQEINEAIMQLEEDADEVSGSQNDDSVSVEEESEESEDEGQLKNYTEFKSEEDAEKSDIITI